MKPSEVFAIVIRTVGLIISLVATGLLSFALLNLVLGGPANAAGMIIIGSPILLVGLWLLRGAPKLLAFAFPKENRHE
jgi:hypothetical protein